MSEAIEEVIFPALGLVFLLLGIVLIVSILFTAFSPYDQIAFANAERLSATLNRACLNPSDTINLNSLELQQNVPILTWAFTILPRWMIRINGDPNYILYYEAFPPGDAVGWEVYHDFQNRIIVPLPDQLNGKPTNGASGAEVGVYACDLLKSFQQSNQNQKVDALIFSNIVLSEKFRSEFILKSSPQTTDNNGNTGSQGSFGVTSPDCTWDVGGPLAGELSGTQKFFSFGKWQDQGIITALPGEGKNQFVFSNYAGLTELEKSAIKYEPCGANALCLKTRSGVYSFPLDQCKNQIKGIHLYYDARQRAWVYGGIAALVVGGALAGGAGVAAYTGGISSFSDIVAGAQLLPSLLPQVGSLMWKVTKFSPVLTIGATTVTAGYAGSLLAGAFLSYKTSDFSLASPCSLTKTGADDVVTVQEVSCKDMNSPCSSLTAYHLFQYNADSGKLSIVSDKNGNQATHYVCADKINNDNLNSNYPPPTTFGYSPDDKCIELKINVKNDHFCWTKDPYENTFSDTQALASLLGFTPIKKSLSFTDLRTTSGTASAFILAPSDIASLNNFLSTWERRLSWGWP